MQNDVISMIYKNDFEGIRTLLKENSADFPLNTYLQRPLHLAVKLRNKELIKFLVKELSADINCTDING